MSNDKHSKDFEKRLDAAGCNAPRVTIEHIDNLIESVEYYKFEPTTMVCFLTVKNGFSFIGKAACASVENYREELAKELSLKDAKDQVWKMEAYLIKQHQYDSSGIKPTDFNLIAMIAHNVNKAFCESIGDHSQPTWDAAPQWQKDSAINGVKYHLSNDNVTPEQSHESSLKQKRDDGWKYGEVKDAEKKEHPCFRPYSELPLEQRTKDYLFKAVVDSFKF